MVLGESEQQVWAGMNEGVAQDGGKRGLEICALRMIGDQAM